MDAKRILLLVVLVIFTMGQDGCGKKHPRKPSWWPDPEKQKFGLKWPPPKPDGWPADKPWPPLKAVGDDPAFWAELYGKEIDAENAAELKQSGGFGKNNFRYNFDNRLYSLNPDLKPGCGMHILSMFSRKARATCTPYPEAEIRAHCAKAFDAVAALQKCRRHCARNPRQCRIARLIEPPVEAYWRCAEFKCFDHRGRQVRCPEPTFQSDCAAFYICDCNEL